MEESQPVGLRAAREPKSAIPSRELKREVEGLSGGGILASRLKSSHWA